MAAGQWQIFVAPYLPDDHQDDEHLCSPSAACALIGGKHEGLPEGGSSTLYLYHLLNLL